MTSTNEPGARPAGWLQWPAVRGLRALAPGSALSAVIAMAATFAATLHGGPVFLYALFFGIAFHYLSRDGTTRPGVEFCARTVLRLGVALLGARITAVQIAALGWSTVAVVVVAVASTIACGAWLGRRLGMTRAQGVLSGGAVAICGASAALAISAVLPRERGSERFTLMVVLSVTVLSTVAMVLYPLLARALGLPPQLAGLFIGATIHDVAQVVGAGYTLGPETGDVATVVKLFRVAMLAVVVAAVSICFRSSGEQREAAPAAARAPLVPWFLWVFVALVALNSLGGLPARVGEELSGLSRACLMVAIAALGVKTSFRELARAGWRPFALLLVETLWLAGLVLGAALLRA
ncbi:MAG: YeiH family protein [Ramlibacter sp.]